LSCEVNLPEDCHAESRYSRMCQQKIGGLPLCRADSD
jgi:hypothetical protein